MSLYREWKNSLPFEPAERAGGWGVRTADDPQLTRLSLALGSAVAVCLATGGGLAPRVEWGAACFFGLVAAVFARGLLLAWRRLGDGGWRAWRRREANEPAIDRISAGVGFALALFLATGGGGIGPVLALAPALLVGLFSGLLTRALLALARWP